MITSGCRPFRAHPVRSVCLNFIGSIHEIDSSIAHLQHHLSISSRSDPHRVFYLALILLQRYRLLNQREDLDKAIVHLTKSILLSPLSRLQHGPIIFDALLSLSSALLLRSTVSKQPEDAICSTNYLSHLRDQSNEIPSIPRNRVTKLLVNALALQVKLEAGNLSMADGPGEFMITSGSRPYRARSVRSVLTHCLQDQSTK